MAETQKTEVLPSITGFKKELDKATENSNIDREELDRLMIEYEKEKGAVKGETQGKIEAFFKNMVYTMLRTGGFKITNPEKDFVILGSLGYKEDINTLKTTYTEKKGKGSNWAIYEKDGKIAFKELLISSGKIGVVEYDKNNMDGLKRSIKTEVIFQSVKRIPGLEKTHELSDLNFIVKPNGSVQPSEGLSWIEDNNPENFDLKLMDGYEVRNGQVVKIEPAVAPAQAPAVDIQPDTKSEKKKAAASKEKSAETPKQKKKSKESHLINGFETDNKLVGLTGKIKGMHVNLRKENGDRTGKTVSKDVSVNLTGRTGKRNINGKDIEYCEVTLPGEKGNMIYFVAKTYIEVNPKQSVPETSEKPKNTSVEAKKLTSPSVVSTLSPENQEKLKAGEKVVVGNYTVIQRKVVEEGRYLDGPDIQIGGVKEGRGKFGTYNYIEEKFPNTFELRKNKDEKSNNKYILEMNGTGLFGDEVEYFTKLPTTDELTTKITEMTEKYQKEGRKSGYTATTGDEGYMVQPF